MPEVPSLYLFTNTFCVHMHVCRFLCTRMSFQCVCVCGEGATIMINKLINKYERRAISIWIVKIALCLRAPGTGV